MNYYQKYRDCIDACLHCFATCNNCAASCLEEENVGMMAKCIKTDVECAALCQATAQVLSTGGQQAMELCRLCAETCEACADECARHEHEHCKRCAEACRKCAEECRKMAA